MALEEAQLWLSLEIRNLLQVVDILVPFDTVSHTLYRSRAPSSCPLCHSRIKSCSSPKGGKVVRSED